MLPTAAWLDVAGIRIMPTAQWQPFHDLLDFITLGIDPARERLIIVKSGYLPLKWPARRRQPDGLVAGAVDQGIARLTARRIHRPMFPLDTDLAYWPVIHFCQRGA